MREMGGRILDRFLQEICSDQRTKAGRIITAALPTRPCGWCAETAEYPASTRHSTRIVLEHTHQNVVYGVAAGGNAKTAIDENY